MLIVAGATLAVGAVLLMLGLRGRRTDDHPLCRACRFDLVGLPPDQAHCPECGADVSTARSRRAGHRRRIRSVIALATVVLLAGIGLGGAAGWGWAARFNWNTIKPVWWLKSEAQGADRAAAGAAMAELTDRLKNKRLTADHTALLVVRGLDRQADPDRAWIPQWGDFLETAWETLSPEQREGYIRGAIEVNVGLRPRAVRGEACALQISMVSRRLGTIRQWVFRPTLESAEIAGQSVPGPRVDAWMGLTGRGAVAVNSSIVLDCEPGDRTLRTTWDLKVYGPGGKEPPKVRWIHVAENAVVVLPAGASVVRLVENETLRPAVVRAIRAEPISASAAAGGYSFSSGFKIVSPPADLAFDVFWRADDGREWPVGSVALKGGFSGEHGYGYGGDAPGLGPEQSTVDVVLRPSLRAAGSTTNIVDVWDGEVVIRDVPIEWPKREPGGGP